MGRRPRYRLSDSAQQIVGGFLLSGPFVVTEEVWLLAENMTMYHGLFVTAIVFAIGYGALYKADSDRDPDHEAEVAGIPLRFISLMIVSFGSVTVLALAFTAPDQFMGHHPLSQQAAITFRALAVAAMFSVVGAATADSVF